MGWLEKGPSASLFVRYVSHRICSSLTPRIQTLLKPTVGLLLMIRCTRLVGERRTVLPRFWGTPPARQLIVLELELVLEAMYKLPQQLTVTYRSRIVYLGSRAKILRQFEFEFEDRANPRSTGNVERASPPVLHSICRGKC